MTQLNEVQRQLLEAIVNSPEPFIAATLGQTVTAKQLAWLGLVRPCWIPTEEGRKALEGRP